MKQNQKHDELRYEHWLGLIRTVDDHHGDEQLRHTRPIGLGVTLRVPFILSAAIALLLVTSVPSGYAAGNNKYRVPHKAGRMGGAPSSAHSVAESSTDRVRLRSRLVNTTLTVADRNGDCVNGLTKRDFEVFDNGVRQEISQFIDDDAPLTLGIVYDISGSMKDLTTLSFQRLKSLFVNSHEDDEYFLIAFNERPILVEDFTISPVEIINHEMSVNAKGSTALYDAVYLGVEKARQGRHSKKALVIISDGLDNNSLYSAPELRELLQEADVPIYCVGSREFSMGAENLKNICEWSGGRAFFPADQAKTFDVYAQISNMLRRQYVIGFYPIDTTGNDRRHKVRITVKTSSTLGGLSLFYKKAYEAFR